MSQQAASARRGARVIKLKALSRGRYTLMLFATVHKRSVGVQKTSA